MKMTAVGANRSVYLHTIVDRKITQIDHEDGEITFSLLSAEDPGISSGQYRLTVALSRSEIFELFEKAVGAEQASEIEELRDEIDSLKTELRRLGRSR